LDHGSTLTNLQKALTGSRTPGGLDVVYTKLAVDLQNLADDDVEARLQNILETLCEAIECDAVCIALLDAAGESMEQMYVARSTFSACNPEVLKGTPLVELPWLDEHLSHMRLLSIADTQAPDPGWEKDAARLVELQIGSAMFVGFEIAGKRAGFLAFFYGQPHDSWSVDHQLLIKLLGTSFASGLNRLRTGKSLAEVEERDALMICTANDGSWDFDALNNVMHFSPRWKAIMGYADDEIDESPPIFVIIWPGKAKFSKASIVCGGVMASGAGCSVGQRRYWTIKTVCDAWLAWKRISPSSESMKKLCSVKKRARRSR
jgi:PAS domain-containing protein